MQITLDEAFITQAVKDKLKTIFDSVPDTATFDFRNKHTGLVVNVNFLGAANKGTKPAKPAKPAKPSAPPNPTAVPEADKVKIPGRPPGRPRKVDMSLSVAPKAQESVDVEAPVPNEGYVMPLSFGTYIEQSEAYLSQTEEPEVEAEKEVNSPQLKLFA